MPDTLLLETGTDRFLLEDGSGFLLMEVPRCYYDVVFADAPVGYWRFGESSGTTAVDVTGLNNGTYTAAPTLGVAGALAGDTNTAMTLNGTTQYVRVTDANSLDFGDGPMSFEAWVKLSSLPGNQWIFAKGTQHPAIFINPSGQVNFHAFSWSSEVNSGAVVIDTNWHHIVGTKDIGATWRLFIDAADVTNVVSTANATTVSTATDLFIGATSVPDGFFQGSVDEVAVYNKVLTPIQVQTHYNSASVGCARHFGPIVLQAMNRAATR